MLAFNTVFKKNHAIFYCDNKEDDFFISWNILYVKKKITQYMGLIKEQNIQIGHPATKKSAAHWLF